MAPWDPLVNEAGWWRRNFVTIWTIAALAITGGAVATILVIGHQIPPKVVETSSPQRPDVSRLLLDEQALGEIVGNIQMQSSGYNTLNVASTKPTSPSECLSTDNFALAPLYADIDWQASAQRMSTQKNEQYPQQVNQAVVLAPSPDRARELLDKVLSDFDACQGKTWSNPQSPNTHWVMHYTRVSDIAIAVSKSPEGSSDWSCQHAYGITSAYIAEVRVCGRGDDQAQAIVRKILANSSK
jgi:hypothetical protein